jgi:hypothetical protein
VAEITKRIRRPLVLNLAFLAFLVLYVGGETWIGWRTGIDYRAMWPLGIVWGLVGGFFCLVLGVLTAVFGVVFWRRGRGWPVLAAAVVLAPCFLVAPLVGFSLYRSARNAGEWRQIQRVDLSRLRADCAALIARHPEGARISFEDPGFTALPATILVLNPVHVYVASQDVVIARWSWIADQGGLRVISAGSVAAPDRNDREIAEGVYMYEHY